MFPPIITLWAFQCVSESQNESEVKHQGAGIYKKARKNYQHPFQRSLRDCWPTCARFFPSKHSLVDCRIEAQINRIRSVMSEDCVLVLEELIQSNLDFAAENEKLHQEHEKTSKHQAETP